MNEVAPKNIVPVKNTTFSFDRKRTFPRDPQLNYKILKVILPNGHYYA